MEDMTIKLIALDLDGTLLTSDKTIDTLTKQKLWEAQQRGIIIVIATGRDKGGIDFVIDELQLEHGNNYVAGVNGQIIYSFQRKEYTLDEVLSGADAKRIMHIAQKYDFEVISCCGYDHYDFSTPRLRRRKKMHNFFFGKPMDYGLQRGKRRFLPIEDADHEITQDINKFVLKQSPRFFRRKLEAIRQELREYELLKVGEGWIEVMPKGVSKGAALRQIGEMEQIDPSQMMAFGDAENDLAMFKTVKYGIAMGNAMDVLKKTAYAITDTNDQQGIAKALDAYVLHPEDKANTR